MIEALFQYQFLQYAFYSAILASIVCGIISVIIVEKKLVMLSGGIAHTSYGGVGLGYLLGFEPIIGAFLFSIAAAFGVGFLNRKGKEKSDVAIGLFWSLGMACGILFTGMIKGYPPNYSSYLFGNILAVTKFDLLLMAILSVIVITIIFVLYNDWKSYLFDEEFASIIGVRTAFLEYILLTLIAMSVVVLLRVVGIILVMALLTAPAATAATMTKSFKGRIFLAVGLGVLFCLSGLFISYELNLATGAVIVIISVLAYALSVATKAIVGKIAARKLNTGE